MKKHIVKGFVLALALLSFVALAFSEVSAADGITLTVTPSAQVVSIGDEVRFTIGMRDTECLNFFAVGFDIVIPQGMAFRSETGAVTSAFKEATGFADADFQETPRLNVAGGINDAVYDGGPLDIATFACTATESGTKTVTLANVELIGEDMTLIPFSLVPADVFVAEPDKNPVANEDISARTDAEREGYGEPGAGRPVDPSAGDSSASGASILWINPFADVNASDWFFDDVEYVVTKGLFNGTSAATFNPNASMTRGMLVTVLGRLADADVSAYTVGGFGDVQAGQYYAAYAEWAKENGIANGVGGGNFAPGAEITRQDLAVLLSRYAEFAGEQFPVTLQYATFADDDLIADYARIAVERLYCGGIVSGKPDNAFDPRGNATRAEVAAMLQRFELNLS